MSKRKCETHEVVKRICIDISHTCKRTINNSREVKRPKLNDLENDFDNGYEKGYTDCMVFLDKKLCAVIEEKFNIYIKEIDKELYSYLYKESLPTYVY